METKLIQYAAIGKTTTVTSGKLKYVITKSISRFGRNTEETIIAVRKFQEFGAQLIFEQEHLDTYKDGAEFIISILSAFAQADNQSRRENQLWSINKSVREGTSELYYRRCYGYTKDDSGNLRINHTEACVVLMIYENYLNGMSIVGLQKLLHEKGIPTASGKEIWSKKAIEHILTNEKYTGSVIVMKTKHSDTDKHKVVENTGEKFMISDIHPAIINKEIFDAVQAERERRTNIAEDENGKHRKKEKYSSKKNAKIEEDD